MVLHAVMGVFDVLKIWENIHRDGVPLFVTSLEGTNHFSMYICVRTCVLFNNTYLYSHVILIITAIILRV